MIYFTADTHFGHFNIIKFCNRPFNTIEEMNDTLIENWNSIVGKNDEIYHLGDFGWRDNNLNLKILQKLNGTKYFIKGNHDKKFIKNTAIINEFIWIKDYYELKINNKFFVLCHYPFLQWIGNYYGTINLFGHSHGKTKESNNQLDVGVDLHEYKPISINEIIDKIRNDTK